MNMNSIIILFESININSYCYYYLFIIYFNITDDIHNLIFIYYFYYND